MTTGFNTALQFFSVMLRKRISLDFLCCRKFRTRQTNNPGVDLTNLALVGEEEGTVQYPSLELLDVILEQGAATVTWTLPECFPEYEIALAKVCTSIYRVAHALSNTNTCTHFSTSTSIHTCIHTSTCTIYLHHHHAVLPSQCWRNV